MSLDDSLRATIRALPGASATASDEEIGGQLAERFPEVVKVNQDDLLARKGIDNFDETKGWREERITVKTESGLMEIPAEVFGHLAMHPVGNDQPPVSTAITHVPSGRRIAPLPPWVSKRSIRDAIECLSRLPIDWDCPQPRRPSKTVLFEFRRIIDELRNQRLPRSLYAKFTRDAKIDRVTAEAALRLVAGGTGIPLDQLLDMKFSEFEGLILSVRARARSEKEEKTK
jgi:hypothetical protein